MNALAGLRFYVVAGVGLIFILLVAWSARVNHLRADHLEALKVERKAHAQTIATYQDAQRIAQIQFDQQVARLQAKNKELNDAADQRVASLRADYLKRVRSLARAPSRHAGDSDVSGSDLPQGVDKPGADSILLSRPDAEICAINTARLQAVHDWALGLAPK